VSDLVRYAEASADLDERPELHEQWAHAEDRAVRRALMRSPALTEHVAQALVETRRSGMHTLGSNPRAPIELLRSNPGARRRRERVLAAAPGGLDEVAAHPNRRRYVELGSPTVDLVLARAASLELDTAASLAERSDPPADPWVLAILVARFGDPIQGLVGSTASSARRSATAKLVDRAGSLSNRIAQMR
jgi:hypothetical protein